MTSNPYWRRHPARVSGATELAVDESRAPARRAVTTKRLRFAELTGEQRLSDDRCAHGGDRQRGAPAASPTPRPVCCGCDGDQVMPLPQRVIRCVCVDDRSIWCHVRTEGEVVKAPSYEHGRDTAPVVSEFVTCAMRVPCCRRWVSTSRPRV